MQEDKIKDLLQRTDRLRSGPVIDSNHLIAVVRNRAHHRRIRNIAAPTITAVLLLIAVGLWPLMYGTGEIAKDADTIATLENQILHLQARTDTVVNFVREVLEKEKKQDLLDQLNAQLASIPDPIEEVQKQVDKTAFGIVYMADYMYRELNLKSDAVEQYNHVIKLFPENRWAKMAKQRLIEIENENSKGDS
jgi:hypothetical protein